MLSSQALLWDVVLPSGGSCPAHCVPILADCVALIRLPGSSAVLQGMDVVKAIEAEGTGSGKPKRKITIVKSGEVRKKQGLFGIV